MDILRWLPTLVIDTTLLLLFLLLVILPAAVGWSPSSLTAFNYPTTSTATTILAPPHVDHGVMTIIYCQVLQRKE